MGPVIIHDRVDILSGGHFALNNIEETNNIEEMDELLMTVLLHAAADHRAVKDVERDEQA